MRQSGSDRRSRSHLLRLAIAPPLQPHCRSPGEIVASEAAACERTVVFVHAGLFDQLASVSANPLAPLHVSGADQTAADEIVDDRPDRTTPVADRIEPRVIGIEARYEVVRALRDPLQMLEQPSIADVIANARIERKKGSARHHPRGAATSHVSPTICAYPLIPQRGDALLRPCDAAPQLLRLLFPTQRLCKRKKVAIRAQQN